MCDECECLCKLCVHNYDLGGDCPACVRCFMENEVHECGCFASIGEETPPSVVKAGSVFRLILND